MSGKDFVLAVFMWLALLAFGFATIATGIGGEGRGTVGSGNGVRADLGSPLASMGMAHVSGRR